MKRTLLVVGLLAQAATTFASTIIVSDTGTGNGQTVAGWIGETWTQTGTYTNVTISATLNGGVASAGDAEVYLLSALGPGTTMANQIAAPVAEVIPAGTSGITLFTGLTLGPGTYYLLADESSAGWSGTTSPVYTADAGVTNISSFSKTIGASIAGISPDTPYTLTTGAYFFNVTGTPVNGSATPEPGTMGMLGAGGLGLLLAVRRRRP